MAGDYGSRHLEVSPRRRDDRRLRRTKAKRRRYPRRTDDSRRIQRHGHLSRQGAAELLLLSALFLREGYPNDPLHGARPEDGVCGGEDLVFSTRFSSTRPPSANMPPSVREPRSPSPYRGIVWRWECRRGGVKYKE